jgi:hypothetical protein
MTKPLIDHIEDQVATLTHDMGEVKIALELLREKQGSQIKRHDGIKESFQQHRESMKDLFNKIEKRMHALEDFMLSSLQRLTIFKGLALKLLPVLVGVCALGFTVGLFVDNAEKAVDKANHVNEQKA